MRDEFKRVALLLAASPDITAEEAGTILWQLFKATMDARVTDVDLDETLLTGGLTLFKRGPQSISNKMPIARKWLLAYGLPEAELDELIVMAKLTRGDE